MQCGLYNYPQCEGLKKRQGQSSFAGYVPAKEKMMEIGVQLIILNRAYIMLGSF